MECGAATVTPRKGSVFPRIQGLQTCKKWQTSWFYVKNQEPKEGEEAEDLINLRTSSSSARHPKQITTGIKTQTSMRKPPMRGKSWH